MAIEKLLLVDGVSYLSIEVDDPSDLLLASTVEVVLVSQTSMDYLLNDRTAEWKLKRKPMHYKPERLTMGYKVDKQ